MKLSLIIATYKPSLHLEKTIDSLLPQAKHIHQLVIVIDNDEYAAYVDVLAEKYKGMFNLFDVKTQVNSGRAKARNVGAALSTGDILMFLDDDMIAENDLIEMHLNYHTQNLETIVIGNGYRNPVEAKNSFGKYIVKIESSWQEGRSETIKVDHKNFVFTACNMSLPTEEFKRLEGFDERLKDAEDFDFGMRALNHAINIIYSRKLKAWHDDWPTIEKFVNRHNEYTKAKEALIKIHPDYARSFPQFVPQKSKGVKAAVLKTLGGTLFSYGMSNSFLVKMMPLSIKFMFYRFTIAAHSINNN